MPHKMELWLQGLEQGRIMRLRPKGGSMAPFLRNGDIVTIARGNIARIGDIILTSTTDGWLMHRVVWKSSHRIVTKGDNLPSLDPAVSPRNILGRAVSRERRGKICSLVSFGSRFCGLGVGLTLPLVIKYFPGIRAIKRIFPGGLSSESECS